MDGDRSILTVKCHGDKMTCNIYGGNDSTLWGYKEQNSVGKISNIHTCAGSDRKKCVAHL